MRKPSSRPLALERNPYERGMRLGRSGVEVHFGGGGPLRNGKCVLHRPPFAATISECPRVFVTWGARSTVAGVDYYPSRADRDQPAERSESERSAGPRRTRLGSGIRSDGLAGINYRTGPDEPHCSRTNRRQSQKGTRP